MSTVPPAFDLGQVRAALRSVVTARSAGDEPRREDRLLLLDVVPRWVREIEPLLKRGKCRACGDWVPFTNDVAHALRCSSIPAAARSMRAEAELKALAELAVRMGLSLVAIEPPEGTSPLLSSEDEFPGHVVQYRGEIKAALVVLLGDGADFTRGLTPPSISSGEFAERRYGFGRSVQAKTVREAGETLSTFLRTRELSLLATAGFCPGCGQRLGEDQLATHLTSCADHPEVARARRMEQQLLELRGASPGPLAGIIDARNQFRRGLVVLLDECEWFSSECGWNGTCVYADSWVEAEFTKGLDAASSVAREG